MVILIFLSTLVAINFYLFRTAAVAYPEYAFIFALIVFLAFSSLPLARLFRRRKQAGAALFCRWIGFTWLGVSGIAFFVIAAGDFMQGIGVPFGERAQFQATVLIVCIAVLYGAFAAKSPRVEHIDIRTNKLNPDTKRIRLVQISDLHLGESSSRWFVAKIVRTVTELQPDIIVSTGDLFDGYLKKLTPSIDLLRKLEAPLGKFAVSGNHEVYAGLESCMSLTHVAGFTTLRNEAARVSACISIIGVEDPAAPNQVDEKKLLQSAPASAFTILLKHRPAVRPDSRELFDLQLSGHTHGGQIFPFHFLVRFQYRLGHGLKTIAGGPRIYVSRGTGSWGPQIRLFARPEITVFDIFSQDVNNISRTAG